MSTSIYSYFQFFKHFDNGRIEAMAPVLNRKDFKWYANYPPHLTEKGIDLYRMVEGGATIPLAHFDNSFIADGTYLVLSDGEYHYIRGTFLPLQYPDQIHLNMGGYLLSERYLKVDEEVPPAPYCPLANGREEDAGRLTPGAYLDRNALPCPPMTL